MCHQVTRSPFKTTHRRIDHYHSHDTTTPQSICQQATQSTIQATRRQIDHYHQVNQINQAISMSPSHTVNYSTTPPTDRPISPSPPHQPANQCVPCPHSQLFNQLIDVATITTKLINQIKQATNVLPRHSVNYSTNRSTIYPQAN